MSSLILVIGGSCSPTSSLLDGLLASGGSVVGDRTGAIAELQERLLLQLGRPWCGLASLWPLPDAWLTWPITSQAATALRELVKDELDRQGGPWILQDPRATLLLPLWRQMCAELNVDLKLLFSLSLPTRSLSWIDQRLCWNYSRRGLLETRDLPLLLIDPCAWSRPDHAQRQWQQLLDFCGVPGSTVASNLLNELEPALQSRQGHGHGAFNPSGDGDAGAPQRMLHPRLRRLRQALRSLARMDHETQIRALESLRDWMQRPELAQLPHAPSHAGSWRSRLIQRRAQRVPHLDAGPWFDSHHYRQQRPHLPADHDPLSHYWWCGWKEQLSPHPFFDPEHYRQACHRQGLELNGAALLHFLSVGLEQAVPPCNLADPAWLQVSPLLREQWRAARFEGLHPWASAALALSGGDQRAAVMRLQHWLEHGLELHDLAEIAAAPAEPFALTLALLPEPRPLRANSTLVHIGSSIHDWQLHAWLQRCPLPAGFSLVQVTAGEEAMPNSFAVLLRELPHGPQNSPQLIQLAHLGNVYTPDPEQVALLRRLGVQACLLEPETPANGWLEQPNDGDAASRCLGVPAPAALCASHTPESWHGMPAVLSLGTAGTAWNRQLAPPIWGWPGFDGVVIANSEQARLLASWLNACCREGLQLVRLNPNEAERLAQAWHALGRPDQSIQNWLPPQLFLAPIHPEECLEELRWRLAGGPPEPELPTPEPGHLNRWSFDSGKDVTAAVCISLYNYGDRITTALESVRLQCHQPLELIVVDDGSTDGGLEQAERWFALHGQHFARALLLQHTTNGGLAAARNTAFGTARAPWCFVLDADNTLEPEAVRSCLAVASHAPDDIAVVHPLVEVVSTSPSSQADELALIGGRSWQSSRFRFKNYIDAMALVRRSAWREVGGYTHIPEGWEDFDFWCKLIEAGYQGILCPQRLATYHDHSQSMLATQTHRRLRVVSRRLQQRHPWLKLKLAAGLTEGQGASPSDGLEQDEFFS